jgi:hypothetical protein
MPVKSLGRGGIMPEQSVSLGPRTILTDFEAMVQDYYSGIKQVDEDFAPAGIQSRCVLAVIAQATLMSR